MNAVTPQPALRRLRSIPSRPSHGNAALGHAGIAGLRRRSLVAALRAASSPFPPSPFHIWVRRAAAEDGAGFSSTSHMRPGRWHAGAKGELRCVVTSAIQDGSPSSSRVTPAFDASVRFIRESAPSITPRIVRSIARPRIAARRRTGSFRHGHSMRRTTLRCRE